MANLFESNWSPTKDALMEGRRQKKKNRKQTMDVVLKTQRDIYGGLLVQVQLVQVV